MLSDAVLSKNLEALFQSMAQDPMSIKDYADRLAEIIDTQIKTAKVTVEAGISVTASGSMGGVQGATVAQGIGSLS